MLECLESLVFWWWLWSGTNFYPNEKRRYGRYPKWPAHFPVPPFPSLRDGLLPMENPSTRTKFPLACISLPGACVGPGEVGAPIATFTPTGTGAGGWMSTSLYPFGRRGSSATCAVQAPVVPQKDWNSVASSSHILVSRRFIGFPPFTVSLRTSFCASVIAAWINSLYPKSCLRHWLLGAYI